MITYKAIIQYFDSIADQHQQINSFTYGELNFFDKDKFTEYPALHITPTSTTIDDQVVVYGFDVIIFDRYNIESNKMRNEATCLSDSLLILQDLCKEITDGKYFINADTLISMEMPISAQPFIDTQPDNCSGWATSFNVITPNEASACLIPYFNPERQNALIYTLPNSAPTTLAWYSRERIHNNSIFSGQELTSLAPVVDTVSGSDTLTMSGSSVTWSPEKNAFRMYDVSEATQMSLQHSVVTETEATFFIRIKDFGRFSYKASSNSICFFGDVSSGTNGFELATNIVGKLVCTSYSDGTFMTSDFAICPTNGNSEDNAHKRLESLTLCIQLTETKIIVWYGSTINEKMEMTTSFVLSNSVFGIGNPSISKKSNFYLQEYLYTPTAMSNTDIASTMEWLNYR
tara:strand:+ start:1690 stop:2895 length:1206 start_codon:yes stop_codon:yes gene_type:complete